jgi:hypothetical protein
MGQCALPVSIALHSPSREEFFNQGVKFPSMNHDALNETLGGSILTTQNPWGFHKTVSILFCRQRSCFRLQACFHSVLGIFNLEQTRSKTNFCPPRRDAANYHVYLRGVWKVIVNTLFNKPVSAHRLASGESSVRSSDCRLCTTYACAPSWTKSTEFLQEFSAWHSGLLGELSESPHQFRVDRVFRGILRFGVLRCRSELR